MNDDKNYSTLCCCEYFDQSNERNHILACCCNCIEFDEIFENFINCRTSSNSLKSNMFGKLQDRVRIPWRGGAKQISLDIILPIILVPIVLSIAAITFYSTIITFIILTVFLGFAYSHFSKTSAKTNFFFIWTLWSFIFVMIVFQLYIPLYEILPEENWIFVLFFLATIFCFFKVKSLSPSSNRINMTYIGLNRKLQSNDLNTNETTKNIGIGKIEEGNDMSIENDTIPLLKNDNYLYWLDAVIGHSNHRYFFFGCLFACLTCLLNVYLTMTTICHSHILTVYFGVVILLTDDCSDVYGLYDLSFGYVSALYNLLMIVFLFYQILNQARIVIKLFKNKSPAGGKSFNF